MTTSEPSSKSPEDSSDSSKPPTEKTAESAEPTSSDSSETQKAPLFRRPFIAWPLAILAGIVVYFLADLTINSYSHASTNDAFIAAHVISIAPQITGKIKAVHVLDNQLVKKGEPLVDIDPHDYLAVLAQKKAAVAVAAAKKTNAEKVLQQAVAHIATLKVMSGSLQAGVDAALASAKKSKGDFLRNQKLSAGKVISQETFAHSRDDSAVAAATVISKQKQFEASEAYLQEARAAVASDKAQVAAAAATVNQTKAEMQQAQLQLSYTHVVAPEAGRVTKKSVEPGDYVQVGQSLMAIVPTYVWVTANFKETSLAHLHPGQPVIIEIDAYPDHIFKGKIDSFQAGSGSQFSLLPPENATGNYVKIVQRVPVKILFDKQPGTKRDLGPGMSAVPSIRIHTLLPAPILKIVLIILAVIVALIVGFLLTRKSEPKSSDANHDS